MNKLSAQAATGVGAVVLVVSPFEENAKRVEVHLRSAGHKVRAAWITERAELEVELQRSSPDLVLASEHSAAVSIVAVVETCRRFAPDVPVLALGEHISAESANDALATGARDRVADGDAGSLAHLERVFARELGARRNLRELAQTRALLADQQSRYAALMAATGDAVAQVHEGILTQVNPAFLSLLGYDDAQALSGVPLMDLIASRHQASAREVLKRLNKGYADGAPLDCGLVARDGAIVPVRAHLSLHEVAGEQTVEMLVRPTARTAAAGGLDRAAFLAALGTPAVTGMARAGLFAVIDGFAALEERLGYVETEQVAARIGHWLREQLGANGSVCRFSNEEFGLLAWRSEPQTFQMLATELVRNLRGQPFSAPDARPSLSISVYPLGTGDDPAQVMTELVRQARKLSTDGGSRIVVLGPTARAAASQREEQRKVEMIRRALRENHLRLAYQTIASLEGDNRQHFDVLLRLVDELGAEIPAKDFIGAAEAAGLMRKIDRWVLGRVLRVIAARKRSSPGSMLFVKLSEDTLRDADNFLAWFQELIRGQLFGKDEICFEIAEGALQRHPHNARQLIQAFREVGAGVAIEHFGLAEESAQLLEQLPLDFVKFHQSYTQRQGDKDLQSRMSQLMALAKRRQIKTIASHVEDAGCMARKWKMGVDFIQGFHIREPDVVMPS